MHSSPTKLIRATLIAASAFVPMQLLARTPAPAVTPHDVDADDELLTRLHDANKIEIRTAVIALENSRDDAVKDFAEMLIRDHAHVERGTHDLAHAQDNRILRSFEVSYDYGRDIISHMHKERELARKSGREFDREFLRLIRDDHEKLLDSFDAHLSAVDGAGTATFLNSAADTARLHKQKASELLDQLGN
jgi:putative membrane protein